MRLTGVIQAGGRSMRMGGEAKALLDVGGRRIVERVADVLEQVTDDLLLVTNTPELFEWMGLPMVPDAYPDCGSLGGIYSGLKAAPGEAIFTVACDMPFLSAAVARLVTSRAGMADVVAPRVGPHFETLHACYGRACLDPMQRRLAAGQLKITGFWDEVRVLAIPEEEVARLADPAVVFSNVNTPEDLARARALATSGAPRQ
jgi:molybdopterin-guanine dinucleotide biosynthesis protein A